MIETAKKRSLLEGGWLPPQRKVPVTEEEKREALIRQIKRMEKLSMIEYVRRNTANLKDFIPCYRFAGE